MSPASFFSILTCGTSRPLGESGSSHDALTSSLAAHYCRDIPDHKLQSALLRWADSWAGANDLEYKLWIKVVDMKSSEGWRVKPRGILRKLAQLAIWEMGAPARFYFADAWRLRAGYLGVDKMAWYRTWAPKYQAVYEVIQEWSNEAWRDVKKNMEEA